MDKVSIAISESEPSLEISREEAISAYNYLSSFRLKHEADIKLFEALTHALGIVGKSELHYFENEPPFAEKKLSEWRKGNK